MFRCCWKVQEAIGKLAFDGVEEHTLCVRMHPDYMAMTNKMVLKYVEPLLKDRNGRGYRQRGNQSENKLVYNCCINVNLFSKI